MPDIESSIHSKWNFKRGTILDRRGYAILNIGFEESQVRKYIRDRDNRRENGRFWLVLPIINFSFDELISWPGSLRAAPLRKAPGFAGVLCLFYKIIIFSSKFLYESFPDVISKFMHNNLTKVMIYYFLFLFLCLRDSLFNLKSPRNFLKIIHQWVSLWWFIGYWCLICLPVRSEFINT